MKLSDMAVPGVILAVALLLMGGCPDAVTPTPAPKPAPAPEPCPDGKCPRPAPEPQPRPWPRETKTAGPAVAGAPGAKVAGPTLDGVEVQCDYPGDRHRRNTASKGLGLCVFTSIHHAADNQAIPQLLEMPKWMIERGIPGGGYPEKVAKLIPQYCQEKGMPVPEYIQVESNDLEVLKLACATGRMPCVTYSVSPTGRYGGGRISHMVNLVHADDKHFVVLDNNYPGYDAFEWMSPQEFLRSYSGGGTGWSVIFLEPGPPPPPHNGGPAPAPRQQVKKSECPAKPACDCGCREGENCRCAEGYEWRGEKSTAEVLSLWRKGKELGLWVIANGTYHPLKADGSGYGTPADPPFPPPSYRTRGVEWSKIKKEPRYYHGDYEVTRDDVVTALTATVPQDEKLHRVTFVSADKAERDRFERMWKSDPAVAAVKDAFVGRAYDPEHWHVKGYGFSPGLTVTDRTGKYLPGGYSAELPADVAGFLRRLRPDNQPPIPIINPWGGIKLDPRWLLLVGAAVIVYLATRRGK